MDSEVSSKQRVVCLIGVASGLGVPEAGRSGSGRAGAALEEADVVAGMRRNRVACAWDQPIAASPDTLLPRDSALRLLCGQIEERVAARIAGGALPVVAGGDHAMAVGTWRGAGRALGQPLGLLWIDAHLDAHTGLSSPSGNAHGMPLAALLGQGPNPWEGTAAAVDASRCCVFGARSYEEPEWLLLQHLGVNIVTMDEIRRRGLPQALDAALAHVAGGSFGISIDLDAVDPPDAPAVNTPSAHGLDGAALVDALRGVAHNPQLVAIEIAEYNPERDVAGKTARLVAALLESLTAPGGAGPACDTPLKHARGNNWIQKL
jgi:arginase